MAIDEGIRLSDERTRALMKRLEGTYSAAYKKAIENEKKAIAKYASLTDEALKDLTPEARTLKREAFKREIQRNKALANNIAAELASAGQTAAQIIQGEMTGIYGLNYDFAAYSIQKQSGLNLNFAQYDRNQIAVLVQEGQSPFTQIAYKNLGKDKQIVMRLQNQFIEGVMNGESQYKLIRRVRGVTGQSVSQAKRVVQTERTTVQSQGRQMGIDEANEMGVETDREWSARMIMSGKGATRDAHAQLNGKTAKAGEPFHSELGDIMFPGDPSATAANRIYCYCVLKPKVVSVSPALRRHREKFKQQSFAEYRKGRS